MPDEAVQFRITVARPLGCTLKNCENRRLDGQGCPVVVATRPGHGHLCRCCDGCFAMCEEIVAERKAKRDWAASG